MIHYLTLAERGLGHGPGKTNREQHCSNQIKVLAVAPVRVVGHLERSDETKHTKRHIEVKDPAFDPASGRSLCRPDGTSFRYLGRAGYGG